MASGLLAAGGGSPTNPVVTLAKADGSPLDQNVFARPDMAAKILQELVSIRKLLMNPGSFEQGSDVPSDSP